METWEVSAREAIRELTARYAHAVDRGRFAELAELFVPDGVLEIDGQAPLCGREAISGMLAGVKGQLAASERGAYIRHHVTSVSIEMTSREQARAWSYFFAVTQRGPDHWGRYRDEVAWHEERWRFVSRRVDVDGRAVGSAL
jgi:uncharacterized protein (TIGR02246 family)